MRVATVAIAVIVACAITTVADAEWVFNGTGLGRAAGDQQSAKSVSDGAGGAIVIWRDFRNGSHWDIFAQRVTALGEPLWATNGVPVCLATNQQDSVVAVSDGAGGAVIAWHDYRNGTNDIYAQRLGGDGVPMWISDGVPVCTAAGEQTNPALFGDGGSGFLLAWEDTRSGNADIYAARLGQDGVPSWTSNGVAVCLSGGEQRGAKVAPDGSGGSIVVWEDYRSGLDVYARRVNAAGSPMWAANGVAVCVASNDQWHPQVLADGVGGAIFFWEDRRSGPLDIYGDRFDASGLSQWAANGVAVCSAQYDQRNPVTVTDAAGGAIIAWEDTRTTNSYPDIYVQRVNESGVPQWETQGVLLSDTGYPYDMWPAIVADGQGGAYVTWEYDATGASDIRASHVDATGRVGWIGGSTYVSVCAALYAQHTPSIVLDGTGGAIVAWDDGRSNVARDVFAQRIEPRHGYWGRPEPTIDLAADVRGDEGGKVALDWLASQRDVDDRAIEHYSIWRATRPVEAGAGGTVTGRLVDPTDLRQGFRGSATWIQSTPRGDFYWEWIGEQDAIYFPAYSYTVETRSDSTAASPAMHYFLVIAHTTSAGTFWPSDPDSGYSVDNLAPVAPSMLEAERSVPAGVRLAWVPSIAADLRDYAVYRSKQPGVVPDSQSFLGATTDTVFVDASPIPGVAYHYVVTAVDVHGNESPPSPEAFVAGSTSAQDLLATAAMALLPNAPNPFRATTTLRFGLARASDVVLSVFDVRGRRVWTRTLTDQPAGWHDVRFDAVDEHGHPLASGVYVYRVAAAGLERSRSMLVTR